MSIMRALIVNQISEVGGFKTKINERKHSIELRGIHVFSQVKIENLYLHVFISSIVNIKIIIIVAFWFMIKKTKTNEIPSSHFPSTFCL